MFSLKELYEFRREAFSGLASIEAKPENERTSRDMLAVSIWRAKLGAAEREAKRCYGVDLNAAIN